MRGIRSNPNHLTKVEIVKCVFTGFYGNHQGLCEDNLPVLPTTF